MRGSTAWRRVRRADGFTLVELMVTMVIVAMAAALVAPAIDAGLRARELRSAVRNLAGAFKTMQAEAIRRGQRLTLSLDPLDNIMRVEGGEEGSGLALGDVARMARFSDAATDAYGVAHVRFYPNGSTSGLAVLVKDIERPEDAGYVVRLDPLIGSVTVLDEPR